LNKINRKRNEMEHEFKKTTREEVKDFYDVAALFFSFTKQFLHKKFTDFEVHASTIEGWFPWLDIEFFPDDGLLKLAFHEDERTGINLTVRVTDKEIYTHFLHYIVCFIINR